MRICRELLYWPRMSSRFEASHRTRGRSGRPARLTKNGWIPLAKSPEHNPCGKIYSHHSAKLDKTRTSTLTSSTTMHSVGSVCRLVVISPTVSGFTQFRNRHLTHCRTSRGNRRELLRAVREAVAETSRGGAAARAVALAAQAESLLALLGRPGDDARVIDTEADELEAAE